MKFELPWTAKKVAERVLTALAILIVFFTVMSLSANQFSFFAVTRGVSMQPTFATGDLVLYIPYQLAKGFKTVGEGDIIVFRAPAVPPIWVHRVLEVEEPGVYRTKGDNNLRPDPFPVKESEIMGLVPTWGKFTPSLPAVGTLWQKWQSYSQLRWGLLLLTLVLLLALPSNRARRRRLLSRISPSKALLKRLGISTGVALVVVVLTVYPFLSKSGYTAVGYQVAEGDGISMGGSTPINLGIIKQGDSRKEERKLANNGLIPMVVVFQPVDDSVGEVCINPSRTVIGPLSRGTVEIGVQAKEIGPWRNVSLSISTVPYLMPVSWVVYLSQIHPLAPNLATSVGFSFVIVVLLFALLKPHRRLRVARRRTLPLKEMVGGLVGTSVVLAGVLLPLAMSTGLLITNPPVTALTSVTWADAATIAYREIPGLGAVAGEPEEMSLFQIDNHYAQPVRVEVQAVSGGLIVYWEPQKTIDAGTSQYWWGVVNAPAAGTYYVEFQMQVFAQPGVLVASFSIPVSVQALARPETIAATVNIDPDTLNLKSNGNSITAYIELPVDFSAGDIDVATVKLDVLGTLVPAQLAPIELDNAVLMVKFNRQAVITALNGTTGSITLTVTGQLTDGLTFTGKDIIEVIPD